MCNSDVNSSKSIINLVPIVNFYLSFSALFAQSRPSVHKKRTSGAYCQGIAGFCTARRTDFVGRKGPRHAKPYPKTTARPHAAKDAKDVERMRLEHDLITDSGIVPATKGRHAIYCLTVIGTIEGHSLAPR